MPGVAVTPGSAATGGRYSETPVLRYGGFGFGGFWSSRFLVVAGYVLAGIRLDASRRDYRATP
jgi:hypothetical protein